MGGVLAFMTYIFHFTDYYRYKQLVGLAFAFGAVLYIYDCCVILKAGELAIKPVLAFSHHLVGISRGYVYATDRYIEYFAPIWYTLGLGNVAMLSGFYHL